jgi:hypothetical protein
MEEVPVPAARARPVGSTCLQIVSPKKKEFPTVGILIILSRLYAYNIPNTIAFGPESTR